MDNAPEGTNQVLLLFMRNCNCCLLQVFVIKIIFHQDFLFCRKSILQLAGLPIPCYLAKERHCEIALAICNLWKRKALWNWSCHLLHLLATREHHLLSNGNLAKRPLHIFLWKLLNGCTYETDFFPKDDLLGDLVKCPFQASEIKPLE